MPSTAAHSGCEAAARGLLGVGGGRGLMYSTGAPRKMEASWLGGAPSPAGRARCLAPGKGAGYPRVHNRWGGARWRFAAAPLLGGKPARALGGPQWGRPPGQVNARQRQKHSTGACAWSLKNEFGMHGGLGSSPLSGRHRARVYNSVLIRGCVCNKGMPRSLAASRVPPNSHVAAATKSVPLRKSAATAGREHQNATFIPDGALDSLTHTRSEGAGGGPGKTGCKR